MLVARELSYYPEEHIEEINKPQKKVVKNKKKIKNKKSKNIKTLVKLMSVGMAMMFFGLCLLILFGYANITAIRLDITKLEAEKVELEKTKMNLIADLEGIKSSPQIAENAMIKLGMGYPEEGQIVYLSVNGDSKELVKENIINNQIKKVFNKVSSLF